MKIKGLLIFVFYFMAYCVNVYADVPLNGVINFEITRDGLQSKIEMLKAKQGIDEASKAKELNWYQLADQNIANKYWFEFLAASYQEILEGATKQLKNKELTEKSRKKYKPVSANVSEEELELQVVKIANDLRSINDALSKLGTELDQYNNRQKQIREEISIAKVALEKAQADVNMPSSLTANKYELEAYRIYLSTLMNTLSAELRKLELETLSNPVQIQLNKRAQKKLNEQKDELIIFQGEQEKLLEEMRLEKAKKIQEELLVAEQESIKKNIVFQEIVRENIQWSRDLQNIVQTVNQYGHKIDAIEAYRQQLAENYKNAEKKITLAGLSPVLGRILREERRSLTNNKLQYQSSDNVQDQTGLITLAQYKAENKLNQLHDMASDVNARVQTVKDTTDKQLSKAEIVQVKEEIKQLLENQKNILEELTNAYAQSIRILGDYEFSKQQLLIKINQYQAYLDERLLWVPSSLPININYPLDIYKSMYWFISPVHWLQLFKETIYVFKDHLFISSFVAILLVFLIFLKIYLKNNKIIINKKVSKIYIDNIYYTFQVFFYNFLLVLPLPLVFYYVGYLLSNLPYSQEFSRAVGEGLYKSSLVLFILQFFYIFFENKGIAEQHFRWSSNTVKLLRNQLIWMRFIVVPCIFLMYMTTAIADSEHSDSLGRLALIILMLVMDIFFVRTLHPSKGVLSHYFISHLKQWWVKLRYLWFFCVISIPVIIICFSLMGYFISALELQAKVVITLRVIFLAIVIHSLVIRWLILANRQLALSNARKKRQVYELNKKQTDVLNNDAILNLEEEILDIPKINEQTVKVINILIMVGLFVSIWLIWQNIFPAFLFLDNIVLWKNVEMIDNQEVFQNITMINLGLASLYAFIIANAVINFSGIMEVFVFRNMNLEAGTRYAINQLAKYVLISIGFIIIANELGGRWSQVQWLVAALTVGLGFGLQEIFANMVSGIILLFERPIRVGDTVTIDNTSGKVTRIQMRATTIMDWDQKELIVPNKSFITNQLVNWTLTDPVTRVVIPLGISYGADVEHAYKIILETIRSVPLVLEEPEPSVLFIEFGESSLNFSIRVYVSELANRLPATHDIHIRLLDALRKENIEIPFPQRDLHVRTVNY